MILMVSPLHSSENALSSARLVHIRISICLTTGCRCPRIDGMYSQCSQCEQYLKYARWLYRLVRTIDANFKMKQKDKGIENDPPLGDGWAHWVANVPFKAYVEKYGHKIEVSPPPGHTTITTINTYSTSLISVIPNFALRTTQTLDAKGSSRMVLEELFAVTQSSRRMVWVV